MRETIRRFPVANVCIRFEKGVPFQAKVVPSEAIVDYQLVINHFFELFDKEQ
jgi:hypothetical protein